MANRLARAISGMELEERILNGGSLIAAVAVFLPWISGEWLGGDTITYNGFGFYTSFLGIAVFLLHVFILAVTIIPLTGGPHVLKRGQMHVVRLMAATQASILLLAALSVLTKVTLEFTRIEVRFGVYVTLIGSLVATLYAFLRLQEQRRQEVQDFFRHPEDTVVPAQQKEPRVPPPPAPMPPPPLPPEEHHLH